MSRWSIPGLVLALVACTGEVQVLPGDPGKADGGFGPDGGFTPVDAALAEDGAVLPPGRGANVPWDEHEAEDGETTGVIVGPSRVFGEIASESSGRRAVRLEATGQYVRVTARRAANSIVVRYVIPDAPGGGGLTSQLHLYVDGEARGTLPLTSKYAWNYGGELNSTSNNPADLGAHHFYDEVRLLTEGIPAGASVELRREAGDDLAFYVIDLVDLEQVAPPLTQPAGSISIVEKGASANGGNDDGSAIRDAIAEARASGKVVWIPAGRFDSNLTSFVVSDVTIQGAGMWHSELAGSKARFDCVGGGCRFRDFATFGEVTGRLDQNGGADDGFYGAAGSDSRMENLWVEHWKAGWWVGSGPTGATDGLVIRGSRFRNLWADGVNLVNGASSSIIEDCHARNTGDDAFVSWSPRNEGGVNTANVIRRNSVQLPWRANCFAIYGGEDNVLEDNTCHDVVTYPGILVSQQFTSHPFSGTTVVRRNDLVRAGGAMFQQEHGALKLHGFEGVVAGVLVEDLRIVDPTFAGVLVQGPGEVRGVTLRNVTIEGAGTHGIQLTDDAVGSARLEGVSVSGSAQAPLARGDSEFVLELGEGNSGF